MTHTAMPDERAIMTYVSSYYHCFSGAQKVRKLFGQSEETKALTTGLGLLIASAPDTLTKLSLCMFL